jgi:hypothetical protein
MPDHLPQAFHHLVLGTMLVAMAQGQLGVERADAEGLVDGALFLDGHMQTHVQEGVGLTHFRRPFLFQVLFRMIQDGVVLGVVYKNGKHDLFQIRQHAAGLVFFPGFKKKPRASWRLGENNMRNT